MSTIDLLIISIVIVFLLKDVFNLSFYFKLWLGYDVTKEVKPFDCYFCLIMWCSIIVSLISGDYLLLLYGFVSAKIIDKIWS